MFLSPNTVYFKLPCIGYFSSITQKHIRRFSQFYCNNVSIVLTFSSFKVGSLSSVEDPIPSRLMIRSYTLFQNFRKYITLLSHCQLVLVASILSAEFKGILGLKRGNKGRLTWRQKNNVFSAIWE